MSFWDYTFGSDIRDMAEFLQARGVALLDPGPCRKSVLGAELPVSRRSDHLHLVLRHIFAFTLFTFVQNTIYDCLNAV